MWNNATAVLTANCNPRPLVTCRYFVFPQRPEDRVLEALVRKSETIRQQLGSMARVLESRTSDLLSGGIRQRDAARLADEIANMTDGEREATIREELEESRERQQALRQSIDRLRRQINRSETMVGLSPDKLRQAVSVSLGLSKVTPVTPLAEATPNQPATFTFPADAPSIAADTTWAPVIDMLREPRERGETVTDWRLRAQIRPVTFDDTGELADKVVQLHLEHRVVQRLLGRFASQGVLHLDLSRCCFASAAGGEVRAITFLARLSPFGPGAARLHEEIVSVTALLDRPRDPLRPSLATLRPSRRATNDRPVGRSPRCSPGRSISGGKSRDRSSRPSNKTWPSFARTSRHARTTLELAPKPMLAERARRESDEMRRLLLRDQRRRIEGDQSPRQPDPRQGDFTFTATDRRQLEDDHRAWDRRLGRINTELDSEPRRIEESYQVRATRIDPAGIVYLWPVTG